MECPPVNDRLKKERNLTDESLTPDFDSAVDRYRLYQPELMLKQAGPERNFTQTQRDDYFEQLNLARPERNFIAEWSNRVGLKRNLMTPNTYFPDAIHLAFFYLHSRPQTT